MKAQFKWKKPREEHLNLKIVKLERGINYHFIKNLNDLPKAIEPERDTTMSVANL